MDFLTTLPVWLLALLIFLLRIVDVALGTCRTIAVVQGRVSISVALGFVEVLVWVTTVTHVVQHATSNPWLLLAYATGFAAGNAAGIALEQRLALGTVILRIVSADSGHEIAERLRRHGPKVIVFDGHDDEKPITLLYVAVRRRDAPKLVKASRGIDPHLFYAIDTLRESNLAYARAIGNPTGWRSVLKKK
jgi:uncharacterized protein YebE (UPF0316 family)